MPRRTRRPRPGRPRSTPRPRRPPLRRRWVVVGRAGGAGAGRLRGRRDGGARHSSARLARSVGPPCSQWRRWWASHQATGRSQPGNTQPPSRTASDLRCAAETTRVVRPRSSGSDGVPPRAGGSSAIAARRLPTSPPASSLPLPSSRRWRATTTRVSAASQASRRTVSAGSGPAKPPSPPGRPDWPSRLASSTVTVSWGRTPPVWGSWLPSSARRASSNSASARRCDPLRSSSAVLGRASGSNAASSVSPASASSSPSTAIMPSIVADTHRPRRWCCRRTRTSAASGSATSHRWATTRRSRGGSSRRAASTSTGSAAAAVGPGRSWVPPASTAACA
jgi:hypothetical protein